MTITNLTSLELGWLVSTILFLAAIGGGTLIVLASKLLFMIFNENKHSTEPGEYSSFDIFSEEEQPVDSVSYPFSGQNMKLKLELHRGYENLWSSYLVVGDHRSRLDGVERGLSLKEVMLKSFLHLEVTLS